MLDLVFSIHLGFMGKKTQKKPRSVTRKAEVHEIPLLKLFKSTGYRDEIYQIFINRRALFWFRYIGEEVKSKKGFVTLWGVFDDS